MDSRRAERAREERAMTDCLFCKIIEGKIPSKKVYEDDDVVAFDDIQPQAPVHVLVIPKKHVATLNDLAPEDDAVTGKLLRVAARIAKERGIAERGWRATVNVNRDAHQLVFHVHLHLMGGRAFAWPPG
jgi:histidine triad (HIT) family protein